MDTLLEKRNVLNDINAREFTLQELRLFSIYLSRINARDTSTRIVKLSLARFYKVMNLEPIRVRRSLEPCGGRSKPRPSDPSHTRHLRSTLPLCKGRVVFFCKERKKISTLKPLQSGIFAVSFHCRKRVSRKKRSAYPFTSIPFYRKKRFRYLSENLRSKPWAFRYQKFTNLYNKIEKLYFSFNTSDFAEATFVCMTLQRLKFPRIERYMPINAFKCII